MTNGHKKKLGLPHGLFACDCGFRYVRTGPDQTAADRLRFDKVISYGPVWEKYFSDSWNDPSIKLADLAKRLDVIPFTLRRHAIRLKLPFPRQKRGSKPISQKLIDEYSNTRPRFEEDLRNRREQWLEIRQTNPDATRQQLITVAPYLYYWLNQHSKDWLIENSPSACVNKPEPIRVDWNEWDIKLSQQVRTVGVVIRTLRKPIRVSKEEVIRRLGHRAWLEHSLDKLPLTTAALAATLESREDFLIRRVRSTQEHFQNLNTLPTLHQFEVRAGTRTATGQKPKVRHAIHASLETLRQLRGNA